jgi:hypothetical protein
MLSRQAVGNAVSVEVEVQIVSIGHGSQMTSGMTRSVQDW